MSQAIVLMPKTMDTPKMKGISKMSNGDLIEEIRKILTQEKPVPEITERAIARVVLAALTQIYGQLDELNNRFETVETKMLDLEKDLKVRQEARKKTDDDLRKVIVATITAVIAVVIDIILHISMPGF